MAEPNSDVVDQSQQDAVIDTYITYKSRGWTAIVPNILKAAGRPRVAILLIGNAQDGWFRALSVTGTDRFERAAQLAERYNAAPSFDI